MTRAEGASNGLLDAGLVDVGLLDDGLVDDGLVDEGILDAGLLGNCDVVCVVDCGFAMLDRTRVTVF